VTKDRRSVTSRANLGKYIPEALDREVVVLSARVPARVAAGVDREARAAGLSRSGWLRALVERVVG
jgi:hypothetical protein